MLFISLNSLHCIIGLQRNSSDEKTYSSPGFLEARLTRLNSLDAAMPHLGGCGGGCERLRCFSEMFQGHCNQSRVHRSLTCVSGGVREEHQMLSEQSDRFLVWLRMVEGCLKVSIVDLQSPRPSVATQ